MSQREAKLLWLKDMFGHLSISQKELMWTEDPDMIRVITETMLRDLESCRHLCEELHRKAKLRQMV